MTVSVIKSARTSARPFSPQLHYRVYQSDVKELFMITHLSLYILIVQFIRNIYPCKFMQCSNQPIMWPQHKAYIHADPDQGLKLTFRSNVRTKRKYDLCDSEHGMDVGPCVSDGSADGKYLFDKKVRGKWPDLSSRKNK